MILNFGLKLLKKKKKERVDLLKKMNIILWSLNIATRVKIQSDMKFGFQGMFSNMFVIIITKYLV